MRTVDRALLAAHGHLGALLNFVGDDDKTLT